MLLLTTSCAAIGVRAAFVPLPATCESLASIALPGTTIATAQAVPAGAFTPPAGRAVQVPAMCRVAGTIKPTADSDIKFEVWLPASGWTGRLQGVGNGAFAGSIDFNQLATLTSLGYAVSSTDTGHSAGMADAGWALGHPEKVIDFGYRAIHETAVASKAIVSAFYGRAPRRAYFNSCSNGGRQALMEAQRYPEDYDGIIAGAPANDWTHLLTAAIWDSQVQSNAKARITAAKLPAIEAAVLKACDKNDHVEDGVIENPAACKFDPGVLQCQAAETDACLTPTQVEGVRMLFGGPQTSDRKNVYPGHPVGGITGNGGWSTWVTGPSPGLPGAGALLSLSFFRNMVFERADWDANSFVVDRDVKITNDKLASTLNATDPDLSRFARRGGKLILYHGWADAAISAVSSINYFNSVVATMGDARTQEFVRLYLAPGVQHCVGGPGPDDFGQMGPGSPDRQRSISTALQAWVEDGIAPQHIIASKYRSGVAAASRTAADVIRTRPLCPYPQVAKWKGSGSTDDAANFQCIRQ
jgi:feruloyl esterase